MARLSNIPLRLQIFAATILVALIVAISWLGYGIYVIRFALQTNIDSWLQGAATGATEMFAASELPKIIDGTISDEEYRNAQNKLRDFQEKFKLDSIFILVKNPKGDVLCAISPNAEKMSPFKLDSAEFERAFRSVDSISFDDGDNNDEITSRTTLVPMLLPNDIYVVSGAQVDTMVVLPFRKEAVGILLFVSLCAVVVAAFTSIGLSKKITMPIKKLSIFTRKLTNSNFSQSLNLDDDFPLDEISSREVLTLAKDITLMQSKLGEYIKNLKSETDARKTMESEIKIAGQIQSTFLPNEKWNDNDIYISAKMLPARQAAGDFYDYFKLNDGRLSLSIGDVSGKGVASALFMAKADTILKASVASKQSLSEMAECINAALCNNNESCMFLTLFLCAIDFRRQELSYLSCGHNPIIVKRANGDTFYLNAPSNIALGLVPDAEFVRLRMGISSGDTLILYTDGITEAISQSGEFYGEKRLLDVVENINQNASASEISSIILKDIKNFADCSAQNDDITLLVAKLK